MEFAQGSRFAQVVYVAAELGLADLLANGPRSIDDLATATSTNPAALARLVRALAAIEVVREHANGDIELTDVGAPLRSDVPGSLRSYYRFVLHDTFWRSWGGLLESVRTNQPAVERIFGRPVFEVWASDPETIAIVNEGFGQMTSGVAGPALLNAYDLSSVTRLVDVGGGNGALLATILRARPHLHGILFDLPHVSANAEPVLAEAGVLDRCAIRGGDFFVSVPEGGDAYLLHQIIHDWGDDRAISILRACRAAMRADGKLLLFEVVLQPRLESGPAARTQALFDLNMLVLTPGGRERTKHEFQQLADASGFRITQVLPTASPFSIVEAVPV
jgi:hypothetical protein